MTVDIMFVIIALVVGAVVGILVIPTMALIANRRERRRRENEVRLGLIYEDMPW